MANIAGLYGVQNMIAQYTANLSANFKQLSGGSAITSPADNPAGYSASAQIDSQISSMGQAANNIGNGQAMLDNAGGGLGQINDMLSSARTLAVQAMSGTLNDQNRQALNTQYVGIMNGIDQIVQQTQYNGSQLLSGQLGQGAAKPVTIQTGTGGTSSDQMTIDNIQASDTTGLGLAGSSVSTPQNATAALGNIDAAIKIVNQNQAGVGANQNSLSAGMQNLAAGRENLTYANDQISGLDYGKVASQLSTNRTLMAAGIKALKAGLEQNKTTVGSLIDMIA